MIGFQQLRQAQPELYARAGRTFQNWADKLDTENRGIRDRIIEEVFGGDVWDDKAADAGRDYLEGLMRGVGTFYDDLDAIGGAMVTYGRRLGEAQHLLTQNVNRAEGDGLRVDGQGQVQPPEGDFTAKEAAQWTDFVGDCQRGINQAVEEARAADRECAGELQAHATALPTIKQLNAESDRMNQRGREAAKEAKRLMAHGLENLSADELQRLQNLMRHADDPAFSTEFLETLGPKGALALNVFFARAGNSEMSGFFGLGKGLQEDLAEAFASATDKTAGQHVTYPDHRDFSGEDTVRGTSWIEQLKEAGRSGLGTMGRGSSLDLHGLSGYHSLATLLDDAEFFTDFLNEVGRDMYRYDATEDPDDWRRNRVGGDFDLDLGDPNELGLDPMSGLMQGLAGNPEAAQDFFSTEFTGVPKEARDPVDYLLTGRDWGDGPDIPGTSHLGDALETATTTVRNQDAAEIMGQAVHSLGSHPAPMPANMRDSFGSMVSHWIDDVNHSIGGWSGEKADDSWTIPVDLEEIPGDQPHAYFRSEEILEVMGEAAKDPNAYQQMWDHQRAYTAMALDHSAAYGTESDFNGKAMVSGQVFGALNAANADAAKQLAQQSVAGVETAQAVTNYGVGAIAAGAGTAIGGPAGAAAGSLMAQGGSFAVNEFVDEMKHNATAADYEAIEAMYGNGERAVQDLVDDAIWRNETYGQVPELVKRPDGSDYTYPNGEPVRVVDVAGKPIPRAAMDDYQQRAYNTWMENHGTSQELKQNVEQSIAAGRQKMRNASIASPFESG